MYQSFVLMSSNTPGCFPQEARGCVQHEARPFGPAHYFGLTDHPHPAEHLSTPRNELYEQPARRRAPEQGWKRRRVVPAGRKTPSVFAENRRSAESRWCPASPALPHGAAALSSRGQQLRGVFQTERRSSDLHRPHLPPAEKHDRNGAERESKGTGGTEPQISR